MPLDDETVRTWIFYAAFLMGSFTLLPGLLAFPTNISPKTIGLVALPYCLLTMTVSIATYVVPPADMEERGKTMGAGGIYRSLMMASWESTFASASLKIQPTLLPGVIYEPTRKSIQSGCRAARSTGRPNRASSSTAGRSAASTRPIGRRWNRRRHSIQESQGAPGVLHRTFRHLTSVWIGHGAGGSHPGDSGAEICATVPGCEGAGPCLDRDCAWSSLDPGALWFADCDHRRVCFGPVTLKRRRRARASAPSSLLESWT